MTSPIRHWPRFVRGLPPADREWIVKEIDLIHYGTFEEQALSALAGEREMRYPRWDNERLADEGISYQVSQFNAIRERGCCGDAHFRLGPSPSGRFYLYGFNYGH